MTNPHGGYGWQPSRPDFRDRPLALARFGGAPIPPHRDDRAAMPPVYNQERTSSCCGNGSVGAVHYMRIKEGLSPFVPSRMFAYYNGRARDGAEGYDGGSQVRSVIAALATSGACPESEWSFDPAHINTRPADKCYFDAKTDLVTGYASVPQDIDAIRACIANDIPVVFGFSVYASFESDAVAKSGVVPMPGLIDIQVGGHCVLACGYSDKSKFVFFRNSYGPGWGDAGYGYMPYDYISHPGLAADFWQIDVVTGR